MREFMKGGLFFLFAGGLSICAMSAVATLVVMVASGPLFSTRQFEELFGVELAFWTGLATTFLSALTYAALDYVDRRFPEPEQLAGPKDRSAARK